MNRLFGVMRTTIDFHKPLLDRAKRKAASRGHTLSQLVCEAVGEYLARETKEPEEPFEVITCGEPGGYAPTPAEMAEALEEDDARIARRKAVDARP